MNREQKKSKKWLWPTVIALLLILAITGASLWSKAKSVKNTAVKIGIVTDLTGPVSYWGESTRAGAELAAKELNAEGYNLELVFGDYKLDPTVAMSEARKMLESDNIDGLYAEFNPAVYTINPYIKAKNKMFVYDAAPISPLAENDYAFKTYLDYQVGNRLVAEKFKNQGVEKIGVLKMNLEPGELGLEGVKDVYGDKMIVETYDLGATDLKTQVLKLKNAGAQAVMNVATFEGDNINTLKAMRELDFKVPYGTVDDSVTENVTSQYGNELKGAITFGFPKVDKDFSQKLASYSNGKLATEYAAAISYTHIKQMVKAIVSSKGDSAKAKELMSASKADSTIGFNKFNNRIADLDMTIKEY